MPDEKAAVFAGPRLPSSTPGDDPNPNTGDPFRARDYRRVARNVVYLDRRQTSHVILPVVQVP